MVTVTILIILDTRYGGNQGALCRGEACQCNSPKVFAKTTRMRILHLDDSDKSNWLGLRRWNKVVCYSGERHCERDYPYAIQQHFGLAAHCSLLTYSVLIPTTHCSLFRAKGNMHDLSVRDKIRPFDSSSTIYPC